MAVVQEDEDLQGPAYPAVKDADGYYYTAWGSIRFYKGKGNPTNIITAPIGSMYMNRLDGILYSSTTGVSSGWQAVGAQT